MTGDEGSGRVRRVGPGIFAALAAHTGVLAVVYALFDDADRAGLALLILAAVAAAGFAAWLAWFGGEAGAEAEPASVETTDPPPYLPTSSLAPLLLGSGATLAIAGVPLGLWVLVPGLVLLGWGVSALARQSRDHT